MTGAVVNERDKIMRAAPSRIVGATPPTEIITPNTGITLVSDVTTWMKTPPENAYRIMPSNNTSLVRETLTVVFKDIPANNPVTWKIGSFARSWSEAKQAMVLSWFSETTLAEHGIVLTGSANGVRTVEMSSYSRIVPHPSTTYGRMSGGVRVSTTYGGTEFVDLKEVRET